MDGRHRPRPGLADQHGLDGDDARGQLGVEGDVGQELRVRERGGFVGDDTTEGPGRPRQRKRVRAQVGAGVDDGVAGPYERCQHPREAPLETAGQVDVEVDAFGEVEVPGHTAAAHSRPHAAARDTPGAREDTRDGFGNGDLGGGPQDCRAPRAGPV